MQDRDPVERGTWLANDAMLDIEDNFALDQKVMIKDQCILREVHGTFDGILDRDESEFGFPALDGVQHVGDRCVWNSLELA